MSDAAIASASARSRSMARSSGLTRKAMRSVRCSGDMFDNVGTLANRLQGHPGHASASASKRSRNVRRGKKGAWLNSKFKIRN